MSFNEGARSRLFYDLRNRKRCAQTELLEAGVIPTFSVSIETIGTKKQLCCQPQVSGRRLLFFFCDFLAVTFGAGTLEMVVPFFHEHVIPIDKEDVQWAMDSASFQLPVQCESRAKQVYVDEEMCRRTNQQLF